MNRFKNFTNYELAILNKAIVDSCIKKRIEISDAVITLQQEIATEIITRTPDDGKNK